MTWAALLRELETKLGVRDADKPAFVRTPNGGSLWIHEVVLIHGGHIEIKVTTERPKEVGS